MSPVGWRSLVEIAWFLHHVVYRPKEFAKILIRDLF